jgi:NCS1 family nucleobase:cation symporter-1
MLSWFYTYGWFTGSILGGLIYYVVARKVEGVNDDGTH